MKDYSINNEEYEKFILRYIEDGNTITAKFANGNDLPLPNNDKNEQILLEKMNKQVDNSDKFYYENKEELKKMRKGLKDLILGFGSSIGLAIFGFLISSVGLVICWSVVAVILGVMTMAYGTNFLKTNSVFNDLLKNRQFREIEEKLNENIRKTNENVLANTSKKMKQFVEKAPENKPVFNINSFNYVPYSDIQQVMDNIKRNEVFGFDYSDTSVKEQGKIRKRRR